MLLQAVSIVKEGIVKQCSACNFLPKEAGYHFGITFAGNTNTQRVLVIMQSQNPEMVYML